MSATQALLIVASVWVLCGVLAAIGMRRHGHHLYAWGALGVVLGPLVVPLAISSLRSDAPSERVLQRGEQGSGTVDVLIAVDGSPSATAAMCSAIALLGDRLGRVTLAAVLDYDTFDSPVEWGEREEATRALERDAADAAARCGRRPDTVLLAGAPAEALQRYALDQGFELLVAGRCGRGASRMLLGSVATALARQTRLPVFLAGPPSTTG